MRGSMRSWWCRCLMIMLAVTLILIGRASSAYAIDPTPTLELTNTPLPTLASPPTVLPTVLNVLPSPMPTASTEPTLTRLPITSTLLPTNSPSPQATTQVGTPTTAPIITPVITPAILPQQASTLQLEITKTLVGSDLIQVGAYLTFTIRIRNTGSVTVTVLPLIDEYDPAVLQPALNRFQPAPDQSVSGRLDWLDLADSSRFGDLVPGAQITIVTVFRAIGISDNVINRARVEAAIGSGGLGGGSSGSSNTGTVQGGSVTIEKVLIADVIRADAPTVSFAITIRNNGAADLVRVPVEDVFDPAYLRFVAAQPPPNRADPTTGTLGWDNILVGFGLSRLQPGQVVTATTTFAVLAPIDNLVVNRIAGNNIRDEFGNAVQAPRQADVRIRIIGVADTRPTTQPTTEVTERKRTATPTELVVTPAVTATLALEAPITTTAVATATTSSEVQQAEQGSQGSAPAQTGPTTLPRTAGAPEPPWLIWLGLGLILLVLGAGGFWNMRTRR